MTITHEDVSISLLLLVNDITTSLRWTLSKQEDSMHSNTLIFHNTAPCLAYYVPIFCCVSAMTGSYHENNDWFVLYHVFDVPCWFYLCGIIEPEL